MTSWATITVSINTNSRKYVSPPTGLRIDKGNDEYGWVDGERVYALSYGRHQDLRYKEHVKNFNSSWFSGAEYAVICDVNNTSDDVTALVYEANQMMSDVDRLDGMGYITSYNGKRWPEDERSELADLIEENHDIRPVIEPMVLRK